MSFLFQVYLFLFCKCLLWTPVHLRQRDLQHQISGAHTSLHVWFNSLQRLCVGAPSDLCRECWHTSPNTIIKPAMTATNKQHQNTNGKQSCRSTSVFITFTLLLVLSLQYQCWHFRFCTLLPDSSLEQRWKLSDKDVYNKSKRFFKLTKDVASVGKAARYSTKRRNAWAYTTQVRGVFECVAVAGIFPTALSQTEMTVNGCEEQERADGQREQRGGGTSVHLRCSDSAAITHSLQCDWCLQWAAAERRLCLQANLKRQNTTPLTSAAHKGELAKSKHHKPLKWCQGSETPACPQGESRTSCPCSGL